jgi:hypothetical protein
MADAVARWSNYAAHQVQSDPSKKAAAAGSGPAECASQGDIVTTEPRRFTASRQVSDMPIAKFGNRLDPIPRPRETAWVVELVVTTTTTTTTTQTTTSRPPAVEPPQLMY